MKLLEASRLELKIIQKNELIHACKKLFLKFKTSKLHIDEENYKKLSIKFKILLGKRKQSSMKLTLYKKQINLRNFGKP